MNYRNFFPKNERLSLKKNIDSLFESGQSFGSYPLRIIYLPYTENQKSESGVSVLISVPKKRIRHSITRNRIKRLIRESYRVNKSEIFTHYKSKEQLLHIAFIYQSNAITMYADIEKAVKKALDIIRKKEDRKTGRPEDRKTVRP